MKYEGKSNKIGQIKVDILPFQAYDFTLMTPCSQAYQNVATQKFNYIGFL